MRTRLFVDRPLFLVFGNNPRCRKAVSPLKQGQMSGLWAATTGERKGRKTEEKSCSQRCCHPHTTRFGSLCLAGSQKLQSLQRLTSPDHQRARASPSWTNVVQDEQD